MAALNDQRLPIDKALLEVEVDPLPYIPAHFLVFPDYFVLRLRILVVNGQLVVSFL